MYHLFTLQTQMRNEVKAAANQQLKELLKRTSENTQCSENFRRLISLLSKQLKNHKGKMLYGYMRKDIKATVNLIVAELAKDKRIADFYAEWNNLNRQKLSVYHNKPAPDIPLEDNKEFRSIKNAIIKAVAELEDNSITFNSKRSALTDGGKVESLSGIKTTALRFTSMCWRKRKRSLFRSSTTRLKCTAARTSARTAI